MPTMEHITRNDISNPSIAYKHFNFEYVDFIWTEGYGNSKDIYYMRDAKHIWTGINDPETGKGFTITGEPNPFAEQIALTISVEAEGNTPRLEIYNTSSQLVKTLIAHPKSLQQYSAQWSGLDENGTVVPTGVYVIMCSVGDKRTARKIVFTP
jgi:hypothetical protein